MQINERDLANRATGTRTGEHTLLYVLDLEVLCFYNVNINSNNVLLHVSLSF